MRDHHAFLDRERRCPLTAMDRTAPSPPIVALTPLTRLIGREAEVAALRSALEQEDVRLLTVTGAGGIGKTRLALAVATAASATYPDGVVFVDLAPLRESGQVVPTIATMLGVRESGDQPLRTGLARFLVAKRMLLLLDNCEHVLAAAPEIAALLTANPELTVLATSREPLRLRGEREFPLLPLDVSGLDDHLEDSDLAAMAAVALFVERAAECQPDFVLTSKNASAVAAICRRLDGVPLAIELAAARVRILPPSAILSRLEFRLPLLIGGSRDLPARQRTMRDAIAWSYDLLTPEEQALFRRLSVFVGGFTLEAAEAAVGVSRGVEEPEHQEVFAPQLPHHPSTLEVVTSLTEKSLLRRTAADDGEVRFQMLETIREYGREQLRACGEWETAQRRHAAFYLTAAEDASRRLRGPEQRTQLARLEHEHDNVRAALTWYLETRDRAEDALRLTGALHWFWYLRGYYREGRQWLDAALAAASGAASLERARALAGAGILGFPHGEFAAARERLQESIAIGHALGDPGTVAYGLHFLAMGDLPHVNPETSREQLAECVALFREAGDRWGLAMALRGLGMVALVTRQFDEADAPFVESLALTRDMGDVWCLARVLHYSGEVARARGDLEEARARYHESLTLYRELDLRNPAAIVLHNLGYVAAHGGEPRHALRYFAEALATHDENHNLLNIGHCLAGIAVAAALLLGAADTVLERIGAAIWPVDKIDYDRAHATVRARLGDAAFAAAYVAGQTLSQDEAVAEAHAVNDEIDAVTGRGSRGEMGTDAQGTHGLTARELEVLHLLTHRATDREIAESLSISPRTVMHHVSNILAKLDVANRREAAMLAGRLDIG